MAVILAVSVLTTVALATTQISVDTSASGPFSLQDHRGNQVTDQDFRGRYMLIFFGYTSCPDVCPTGLQQIALTIDALGEKGEQIQPVFITLDSLRDTPEVMAEYVRYFHPRIIGLTGDRQQIANAAMNYGVLSIKVIREGNPEDYTMNHSGLTYLLGPDGRFVTAFEHGANHKTMTAGILQYLVKPVE